ncbi:MAG: CBS domain-containing protein [Gammaproteobacteria bacterium]|nr:CBS domain-containing protein [Gammaproteobacteria bacterium]
MKKIPTIKTVMTAFPYSVQPNASLHQALEFMRQHNIRHLPVTRQDELLGLISDRDIKLVLGPDFAYPDPDSVSVGDIMRADTYVVDLDERLDNVLQHMAEHHVHAAVVTRQGKLAGMFTTSDVCRSFVASLREPFNGGGDTAA